ncbi:MAG: aminoacyl-tRNA hydrolase [Acidobacteriota bacterium]
MKLIVGLGNPGPDYKDTRHNVGFMVVEELASQLRVKKQDHAHDAVIAQAQFKGEPVLIMKPLTYMNLSGKSVRSIINKRKIALSDIIVVSDDLDLDLGRIRIRAKGGSGGHKGLQSIIDTIGSDGFARMRLGIGKPEHYHTVNYVLDKFDASEQETLTATVKRATDALTAWMAQGLDRAMNQYNS